MRRILFSKVTKHATDRNKYENKHEIHGNYTHIHTLSKSNLEGPPMLVTTDMSNQILLFFSFFLIAAVSVLLLDVSPHSEKYACLFLTHIEVSV